MPTAESQHPGARTGQHAGEAALAKSYAPAEHEGRVAARWEEARAFHATAEDPREPYSVFIPPPNVTAALHLGHALNNTLQDILVRRARMQGKSVLWMPGTDHAGIATQTVVEKRLLAAGKRRTDFTREAFVARVQEWKDQYEATILEQLKAMGCSCDFDRTRFTMDAVCARAVREAFLRLFRDGLITRGKRLVQWDPATQTALADDEVEMEEVDGHFWYLRYPLEDGSGHVTVATTRPETMLGDTAVAVHPRDPRAAALRGKRVRLPIVDRLIPIVEDEYVVMPVEVDPGATDPKAQFATGFLKVTPAHDPNDWELGLRHGLAAINVMAPDGTISDRHGWSDLGPHGKSFVGLSREKARDAVVAWFRQHGLLEAVKPYRHSVGHSYRSHVPVEPYLSDQWYVRVTDDRLRGAALRAMDPAQRAGGGGARSKGDGELRFFPARYAKTYEQWHEGIRDWCISRQLWWGHRIPVWTKVLPADSPLAAGATAELTAVKGEWAGAHAAEAVRRRDDGTVEHAICLGPDAGDEAAARLERSGYAQDPDVLDTWFSSALWPLSTLGWPEPGRFAGMAGLLDRFNPSAVLSTAREIITLWVSRMVMFNRHFRGGDVPFRHVFIHCVVQDGHGQKMSKSLGNGVDPRDIIATHGADALRFVLTQASTDTQDVRLPVDILCPHTGEAFTPQTVTTSSGHVVAAPIQVCPKDPAKRMVTAFGAASGQAEPGPDLPMARNTSARFDAGRNLANKLWNASRFALAQCGAPRDASHSCEMPESLADRWMVSRLARATEAIDAALGEYRFAEYAEEIYGLLWRDFCDWYLEAAKPTVRTSQRTQQVVRTVLDAILRLVHPMMPFVTEAIWPALGGAGVAGLACLPLPHSPLLSRASWPAAGGIDEAAEAQFARAQSLVNAIRNLRGERRVEPRRKIILHAGPAVRALVHSCEGVVEHLAGLSQVCELGAERPLAGIPFAVEGEEAVLAGLVDEVDLGAERSRLQGRLAERERALGGYRAKLSNPGYLAKAKPEVVEATRRMAEEAEAEIAATRSALEALGA